MADFCKACSIELWGEDSRDLALGITTVALCEGCGVIQVDPEGNCMTKTCLKAGQPGHGKEKRKDG